MSQLEQPLGRMLSGLGKAYLGILRTKLQHLDIDRNYYALVLIESHDGNLTQQELAYLLHTDKVSIVRVVNYLSEKGYIARVRNASDKRKQGLLLTEKAKKSLPEIRQAFNEINDMALTGLAETQISEFIATIMKIKSNITGNIQIL